MKIFITVASLFIFLFIASCGNNDAPSYDKTLSPANSAKAVTPLTIADTLLSDSSTAASGIATSSATGLLKKNTTPQMVTLPSSPGKFGAGLNPEHGKPGHRCDISVGAPLNSPPQKTTNPQVSQVASSPVINSQQTKSVTNAASITNGAKLNPAHGQPGHDCAVAVGAPLKN
ncbi:MAG: hypothetical protein ABIP80_00385 [Ferruginibacter sp.]